MSDAVNFRPVESPPPRRVAILRALKLGDLLCAVPMLRALRAAWPEAELVLVGLPWAREFVARFPMYLDGFRELPGYPGLPERQADPGRLEDFFAAMRAECFDLALQVHGSGSVSNAVVTRFGAARVAGFYPPGSVCPDRTCFCPWPERGLEIHRLLALVDFLGLERAGDHLEFPLRPADFTARPALEAARELRFGTYICIHPGASVAERCWAAERFAAVAAAVAGQGLQVVLTGTAAEAPLTAALARAVGIGVIDLAGRTNLGALGALLAGSRLLVSNDTGISHLAAALRVPSVIISTGDNPARWAPIDRERHRVLCDDERGVSVEDVLRPARDLLRRYRGPDPARAAARLPRKEVSCDACAC